MWAESKSKSANHFSSCKLAQIPQRCSSMHVEAKLYHKGLVNSATVLFICRPRAWNTAGVLLTYAPMSWLPDLHALGHARLV